MKNFLTTHFLVTVASLLSVLVAASPVQAARCPCAQAFAEISSSDVRQCMSITQRVPNLGTLRSLQLVDQSNVVRGSVIIGMSGVYREGGNSSMPACAFNYSRNMQGTQQKIVLNQALVCEQRLKNLCDQAGVDIDYREVTGDYAY